MLILALPHGPLLLPARQGPSPTQKEVQLFFQAAQNGTSNIPGEYTVYASRMLKQIHITAT